MTVIITDEMLEAQQAKIQADIAEIGAGIDRLRDSRDSLLEAAKEVLSASQSWSIGHPHKLDSALDRLMTAVTQAEHV